jgi:acid phosphatase (class A)
VYIKPSVLMMLALLGGVAEGTAQTPNTAPAAPAAPAAPRRVGYLSPGGRPDILRVLSPPPTDGDSRDAADLAVFRNTRRLQGTPRWIIAQRDNAVGTAALLQAFSCSLDTAIEPAEAPALMKILGQAAVDAGAASTSGKNTWRRKRPFEREKGPVCLAPDEVQRLARVSPDYPSGHATAAWMAGRLIAEVAPDRATEILERARMFGESRVVCGLHHVTAVEAGRTTAEGVLAARHGVAAFRSDLDAAREEMSRLRAQAKPAPQTCAADKAALAERPY